MSSSDRIVKSTEICGGRACIAGHRVRVADVVVWHERRGYSADEIIELFPGLTLADVHAALAYYFGHRPEIESELQEAEQQAQQLAGARHSRLREKLGA
jgi:uncharacterized protein (DUF433 family)